MKTSYSLINLIVGATLAFTAAAARAQDKAADPALLAKAKISHAEAEKTALSAVPNATVKASELEEEDGALRWSFDLKTPGSKKTTEVGVDAVTGQVIENKVESEKEEGDEKKEHHHKKG